MSSTFVFIGDSITDAGRRDDPAGLGTGYVRALRTALLRRDPAARVINAGVGGHRAKDLAERWDTDALAHRPDVLTVYVGINDTWRRYDSDDPTSAEDFAAAYRDMLTRTRRVGVDRVLLMEPFVTPVDDRQLRWGEDLDPKREVVRQLAGEYGASFVALHDSLNAAAAARERGAIAWDGVHPTDAGHELIAEAWLRAYEEGNA